MKNCAKKLLFTLLTTVGASAFANVAVTIDNVVQHFPYDGKIDLTYTVSGVEAPEKFTLGLSCVQGATTNALATFSGEAPSAANGTRTVTWNAAADGVAFPSGKADFLANLRPAAATDGDYMIIDVSGGSEAASFPVTFVSDVADPTNFFNTTEYKTTKIVLKKIKAGSFWMGSAGTETYYGSYETRHYVTLTNDYFIGLFMLTGGQYKNVVGDTTKGYTADEQYLTGGIGGYKALSAADGFLDRLTGRAICSVMPVSDFHAPTEAQWEYACRAGTTTTWFFGEDETLLKEYAYYNNASAPRVGAKKPNPWCLWDLYGTAQEYVYDDYNGKTDYPATTEENPDIEPLKTSSNRFGNMAVRGGAAWNTAEACRSAYRTTTTGATKSGSNGFRLSTLLPDPTPFVSSALRTDVAIDEHSTRTDINAVTLTLVTNRVEYTGSAVSVPIVLTHGAKTLVEGADYTLAYSDNVNLGVCTVTVTGLGDYAGTRLASYRIVSPCVAESQRAVAKIDLRDGVLEVTVPGTLFNLAYNNTADWQRGGATSETVKAVLSAAPLASAESVPAEGDFATVLSSDGEGTVRWRPATRYAMVRLQIVRDGVVDSDCTLTRVIDATINGFKLILR